MPIDPKFTQAYLRGIQHFKGTIPPPDELEHIVGSILQRLTEPPILYLYKAGRNKAIDEWREKQRNERADGRRRLREEDRVLILSELQQNENHRKEFERHIDKMGYNGKPPYSDVLRWYYVQGLPYATIQKLTGRSAGNLYKVRERGLTILKEQGIPEDLVECVLELRCGRYSHDGVIFLERSTSYKGDWWSSVARLRPEEVPLPVQALQRHSAGARVPCFPADCHLVYQWCVLTQGWVLGDRKKNGPILFPRTRRR